jgi:ABC-type transporter Mla subunit MlaD
MKTTLSNFKLGLFIVTGTVLLTILVVMFGAGAFSPRGVIVETYIDGSVQGLDEGSPLKYRGVTIGRVREIALVDRYYPIRDTREARYVLVRMEVFPVDREGQSVDLRTRITGWTSEGMRLRLASQGITGIAYMEADFLRSEPEREIEYSWTPDHLYIPTVRGQLAHVADSIEAIARDLQNARLGQIAANVDRLLTTTEQAVNDIGVTEIGTQIRTMLTRVDRIAERIDTIVASEDVDQIAPRAARTVAEVESAVSELRSELTTLASEGRTAIADARNILRDPALETTIRRLDEASLSLTISLHRIENAVAGRDQQLTAVLTELQQVSANMRQLTELLSRYPSLALFGQPPPPTKAYNP